MSVIDKRLVKQSKVIIRNDYIQLIYLRLDYNIVCYNVEKSRIKRRVRTEKQTGKVAFTELSAFQLGSKM